MESGTPSSGWLRTAPTDRGKRSVRGWLMARAESSRDRWRVAVCSADRGVRRGRVVGSELVTRAGVAQSGTDAAGPGEARLLASGALVQQAAQASGLLALLVVVTVLARRLLGGRAGGVRAGRVAGRLPARAPQQRRRGGRPRDGGAPPWRRDRARTFAAAAGAVRACRAGHRAADRGGRVRDRGGGAGRRAWRRTRRIGGLGLGAVTAAGIAASVYLDGLRAERLLVRAALTGDRRRGALSSR